MANLVLGPLLRYVDASRATVWVETDEPCEVEVLDTRDRTFAVEGHHYALVVIEGLSPGTGYPYEVRLDGRRVWPLDGSELPPSTIRTRESDQRLSVVFGSCRVSGPHEALPTSARGFDRRQSDVDALRAYGLRMIEQPERPPPDLLLLLGDQVYADDVPPETEAFIAGRGERDGAPADEVADFTEYTRLYRESWSEPVVRWVLSTVPTAMIFDDHDVHDDWNTSAEWVATMRAKPWWRERIVGGLMAYWIYQHIGNLSPDDLATDEQYAAVRAASDAGDLLRAFAVLADQEANGARWSYARDLGCTHLLVVDSRCGRVLDGAMHRRMLDDAEFDWLEQQMAAVADHLLVATTLPYLLPPSLHDLEAWNEAISAGRWGRLAARVGERIRQGADLEHWAAFGHSFRWLTDLLRAVGSRRDAPASIVVVSGDVHHAYLSRVHDPSGLTSAVYQVVCSPLRHPMPPPMQWVYRAATSGPARLVTRWLARSAGVEPPEVSWRVDEGPWFDNQIATLSFSGREATLRLERSLLGSDGRPRLETLLHRPLTSTEAPAQRAIVP